MHYRNNYSYYVCNNYIKDKNACCSSHYISCKDINEIVKLNLQKSIKLFAKDGEVAVRKLEESKNYQATDQLLKLRLELDKANINQNKLQYLIKNLYEDNRNGKLPENIFNTLKLSYNTDYSKLCKKITILDDDIEKTQNCFNQVSAFADLINKYVNFQTLDHYILNELIDKIYIASTPINAENKSHQTIEIHYKFIGINNFES